MKKKIIAIIGVTNLFAYLYLFERRVEHGNWISWALDILCLGIIVGTNITTYLTLFLSRSTDKKHSGQCDKRMDSGCQGDVSVKTKVEKSTMCQGDGSLDTHTSL